MYYQYININLINNFTKNLLKKIIYRYKTNNKLLKNMSYNYYSLEKSYNEIFLISTQIFNNKNNKINDKLLYLYNNFLFNDMIYNFDRGEYN